MNTEITGGELQATDVVVINTVREAKPDFVSSFVSQGHEEVSATGLLRMALIELQHI